jgi:hypothetical protein
MSCMQLHTAVDAAVDSLTMGHTAMQTRLILPASKDVTATTVRVKSIVEQRL